MIRITSKFIISNSTRSTEVTFREIVTCKVLYTHLVVTRLPIKVESEKGSLRILGLIQSLFLYRKSQRKVWLQDLQCINIKDLQHISDHIRRALLILSSLKGINLF